MTLEFTRIELEFILDKIRPSLRTGLVYPEDLIYININNKITQELNLQKKMFDLKCGDKRVDGSIYNCNSAGPCGDK